MAAIGVNPDDSDMQEDRFKNELYINWIKTTLALHYLKEGLTIFCDQKSAELHSKITEDVKVKSPHATSTMCKTCTKKSAKKTKKSTKWTMDCNANICNIWLDEILSYHEHLPCPKIDWANSNPLLWPTSHWEVAKLYQPFGCENNSKAEDSDCQALMTLIMDCKFFHQFFSSKNVLQQIREMKTTRNKCIHSKSLEMRTEEMQQGLGLMISLLEEPQLKSLTQCVEAAYKIKQLRDNELEMTLRENKAFVYRSDDLLREVRRLFAEFQQIKTDMKSNQDTTSEDYRQLNERLEQIEESIKHVKESLSLPKYIQDADTIGRVEAAELRLQEIEHDISERLESRIDMIEERLQTLETQKETEQSQKPEDIEKLRCNLIRHYDRFCQRIPIYPLRPNLKVSVEQLYVMPKLNVIDSSGKRVLNYGRSDSGEFGQVENTEPEETINTIGDIFHTESHFYKSIYVSGEAGTGKTTMCEHLVNMWCRCHSGQEDILSEDENFMKEFHLVFYLSLRHANGKSDDLEKMIMDQLDIPDIQVQMLMSTYSCLVLLDGFDEIHLNERPAVMVTRHAIPTRRYYDKCTILTTSRPWKLELLASNLEDLIERQISIFGLDDTSQETLAKKVIDLLNKMYNRDMVVGDFIQEIEQHHLTQYLQTPVLLVQMLGLWFSEVSFGNSQCAIYSNLIEMQLKHMEEIRGCSAEFDESCPDTLPECFNGKPYCQKYKSLLMRLSKLAFDCLRSENRETALVFDHHQTEIGGISEDNMKLCLQAGLLTQHKVYGQITEEIKSISFIHKSHQEFLASVYLATVSETVDIRRDIGTSTQDLDRTLELEKMFIFACGMNSDVASLIAKTIAEKVDCDCRIQEYRTSCERWLEDPHAGLVETIQRIVIQGIEEACRNGQSPHVRLQDVKIDNIRLENLVYLDPTDRKSVCNTVKQDSSTDIWDMVIQTSGSLERLSMCFVSHDTLKNAILSNHSSLHTLNIAGIDLVPLGDNITDILSVPTLSALGIGVHGVQSKVKMEHSQLEILSSYLKTNVYLKEIRLCDIQCTTHTKNCSFVVDLSQNMNILRLELGKLPTNEVLFESKTLVKCCLWRLRLRAAKSALTCLQTAANLEELECGVLRKTAVLLNDTLKRLLKLKKIKIWNTDFKMLCMSPAMDNLEIIELYSVTLAANALNALLESLPPQSITMKLGHFACPVTIKGQEAQNTLDQIRHSKNVSVTECIADVVGVNVCKILRLVFSIHR